MSESEFSPTKKSIEDFEIQNNSVLSAVGHTPLISLSRMSSEGEFFAKAEYLNPTGSVKDRAAAQMLRAPLQKNAIQNSSKQILDSSSGNTGISLACFGASLGLKVTIVLPESASIERQKLLRLYGAKIIFSDPMEGSDGAIVIARELAAKQPEEFDYMDQYSNEANWQAHYFGTAEEIWKQTTGKITHFVAGVGTGGTLMGTGKRLKELNSQIKIIAVEPDEPFHGIEGLKHIESSIKPKIFDEKFPDETVFIKTEDAQKNVVHLAKDQGIFVGTSSGATFAAGKKFAVPGNVVVAVFADQGSRYLSERYLQT